MMEWSLKTSGFNHLLVGVLVGLAVIKHRDFPMFGNNGIRGKVISSTCPKLGSAYVKIATGWNPIKRAVVSGWGADTMPSMV